MMGSSREGYQTKQERDATINMEKISKASSSTSTRQWSAFRNPRIVRVSRSFGGKDRHSKVCTIRGLRDRRIRLSVPTAIQLYDLQDKLGLNQPSKVIDWLLEATKFDIEKLPPLQFPHGFSQFQFHQTLFPIPSATATTSTSTVTPSFFDGGGFQVQNLMATKSRNIWDLDSEIGRVKGKWVKSNEEEDGGSGSGGYNNNNNLHDFVSTQKLFQSHPLLPCFPNSNNNAMSSNNLSLSQFGLFPSQVDPNLSNANSMQFPSSNSFPLLASGNSQLLFGPPSSDSLFTTRYAPLDNNDPRAQVNQIKFLNSASHHYPLIHSINSTVRPFPAPFNSKLLDSDNNNLSQEDRDSTRNS